MARFNYQQWIHLSYLSDSERRLNRALWGLTWISAAYCLAQHVFLSEVPEVFNGGAQLGDLLYDAGIAYIGAFTFYLLVVRLPLRRDRRNVYSYLGPLLSRVAGEACGLMSTLNKAAGFDNSRENTLLNLQETCRKIGPTTDSDIYTHTASGQLRPAPIVDAMHYHMQRAQEVNQRILELSASLSSDVIILITHIKNCSYFMQFEKLYGEIKSGKIGNPDIGFFDRQIFDYLLFADRVDAYQQEFLPVTLDTPTYLTTGSTRGSDEIPLRRFIASTPEGESADKPKHQWRRRLL